MNDAKKFTFVATVAAGLAVLVLAVNLLPNTIPAGLWELGKRRAHYETVITKKGLGLHEGAFWKKKE
jgi:hypothetical protein